MRAQIQIVYFNLKATVSNMKVLDAQNFINNSKSDRIYHSALLWYNLFTAISVEYGKSKDRNVTFYNIHPKRPSEAFYRPLNTYYHINIKLARASIVKMKKNY